MGAPKTATCLVTYKSGTKPNLESIWWMLMYCTPLYIIVQCCTVFYSVLHSSAALDSVVQHFKVFYRLLHTCTVLNTHVQLFTHLYIFVVRHSKLLYSLLHTCTMLNTFVEWCTNLYTFVHILQCCTGSIFLVICTVVHCCTLLYTVVHCSCQPGQIEFWLV